MILTLSFDIFFLNNAEWQCNSFTEIYIYMVISYSSYLTNHRTNELTRPIPSAVTNSYKAIQAVTKLVWSVKAHCHVNNSH